MKQLIDLRTAKVGVEALLGSKPATTAQHSNSEPPKLQAELKVAHPFLEQIQKRGEQQASHKMDSSDTE